jgi:hypothetical protein
MSTSWHPNRASLRGDSPLVLLAGRGSRAAQCMSFCTSTWFDPRWDPRLRRLIQEAVQRTDLRITSAFERAGCTTLEAAKRLTASSSCLEGFTEEQRQIFIDAVGLADLRGNDTDIHIALIISVVLVV